MPRYRPGAGHPVRYRPGAATPGSDKSGPALTTFGIKPCLRGPVGVVPDDSALVLRPALGEPNPDRRTTVNVISCARAAVADRCPEGLDMAPLLPRTPEGEQANPVFRVPVGVALSGTAHTFADASSQVKRFFRVHRVLPKTFPLPPGKGPSSTAPAQGSPQETPRFGFRRLDFSFIVRVDGGAGLEFNARRDHVRLDDRRPAAPARRRDHHSVVRVAPPTCTTSRPPGGFRRCGVRADQPERASDDDTRTPPPHRGLRHDPA